MKKFDNYRNILKNFKRDIENVVGHQNADISQAKQEYNAHVINEKIAGIKSEYSGSIGVIRKNYLRQLDEATAGM